MFKKVRNGSKGFIKDLASKGNILRKLRKDYFTFRLNVLLIN